MFKYIKKTSLHNLVDITKIVKTLVEDFKDLSGEEDNKLYQKKKA